ncbi:MAG: UdgX family uracil-DNA binding protein [Pseudomonadota bacterium]
MTRDHPIARTNGDLFDVDAAVTDDALASLNTCRRCDLWRDATQAVPGSGPARATLMLVGEQPGDQEDIRGQPFIGPAGQLLDRLLAQAQLERHTLYLTNAVKHFKWEARGARRLHKTPLPQEIRACSYWLERELVSVAPQLVVTLGATALKAILGVSAVKLAAMLGTPIPRERFQIVPTYHPSYLLRIPDPQLKAQAQSAMLQHLETARRLLVGQ